MPAQALLLFLATACGIARAELAVPRLTGPVEDTAGIYSPDERRSLAENLFELRKTRGAQVQILTIPSLEGDAIESYSIHVAEKWRLGDKDRDNGVLLLIAMKEHRMRIEVGRGLEGLLTDLDSSRIIREQLTPAFRQGAYYEGTREALDVIARRLAGEKAAPEREPPPPRLLYALILLGVVYLIFLEATFQKRARARSIGYVVPSLPLSYYLLSLGFPPIFALLIPIFAGLVGWVSLYRIMQNWYESRGSGGGWGGGGSWGGGGGSFSGGGSSGGW